MVIFHEILYMKKMMTRFFLRTLIALDKTGAISLSVVIVVSFNDNSALEMTTSAHNLLKLMNYDNQDCN